MATFESDFRFSRPPNGHIPSHSSKGQRDSGSGDDDDDDEPIFGDVSFSSDHAGPSNWKRRYQPAFDDSKDYGNAASHTNGTFDASYDESFQVEPSSDENCELYACLNIDKSAPPQDILKSYRALAIAFHPDKHKDEQLKAAAESNFQKIQHAYEVLSDPQRRAVYDLLGEEGLKTEWRVGQKLKSPEELRAEYERMRLKRAQADIENLIRSRTEATISLDASRVVNPNSSLVQAVPAILGADVRQLFMKASTLSVLSSTTQITYQGSMLARRGAGGGNLLATVKHQYNSKCSIEAGTTLLHPRMLTAKVSCQAGEDSFFNVETNIRNLSGPPPLTLVYGSKLSKSSTGYLKLSTGTSYSFLALFPSISSIPFLQPRNGTVSNLTLGMSARNYSVDVSTDQFLDGQVSFNCGNIKPFGRWQHGWSLSTSLAVSFTGATSVNLNTDKKLTENTSFGLGVGAGLGSGALTMRIRVSRLGQRLSVPIILSSQASARLVVSTILLPGLSIASLQYFYLTPRRRKRIALRLKELRDEFRETNDGKRKDALAAAELLKEQVARKREIELKNNGLVILSACYRGSGRYADEKEVRETELDVTVALQALVTSSQSDNPTSSATHPGAQAVRASSSTLTIPGGRSKTSLIGFCDVLVGSKKELYISYLFNGRRHSVVYDDRSPVAIPMRSHLIE